LLIGLAEICREVRITATCCRKLVEDMGDKVVFSLGCEVKARDLGSSQAGCDVLVGDEWLTSLVGLR